jgi:alkylated DNA repair dioxygenase AlkB
MTLQPFIKESDNVPLTAKEKEFLTEMRALYNYVKALPESKNTDYYNPMLNEFEFIADALADSKFREYLNSIEYSKGKSVLTKLIEMIKGFLGVKPGSALETVVDQVYSLREDSDFKHYDTLKHLVDEMTLRESDTNLKQPSQTTQGITKGKEIQPGLELFKGALSKEEQKEFYEFGKSVLEKHGYNPFPQYVMASAGKMEWSPEEVVGKNGKFYKRPNDYNAKIISHKKKIMGSDGNSPRWTYHYYLSNLDGSEITPIPTNIISNLEKVTGQDMSDYDTVLINFYPIGRTLGWHVDVSEDNRNMDRDIISVSIGADADFHYANTPDNFISGDPEKAGYKTKVENLKSGDIISFGGPSRLISHTVKKVMGTTDLGPIDLSNSNVNQFFTGGLKLNNWRMNFTFRVADPNNNKGKRSLSPEGIQTVDAAPNVMLSEFYNGLTEAQKKILGNLEDLIAEYDEIPFDYSEEKYIESLKCKLS